MSAKKPYRVTQYEELSELGLALFPNSRAVNRPLPVFSKDYRWKWQARLSALFGRGESAGLGLRLLTTTITDLRKPLDGTDKSE